MPHCVQYMNNCICAERGFDQVKDAEIIGKIMEKSAAAVGAFEFDGLKLDSCSQFNNLTWYSPIKNTTLFYPCLFCCQVDRIVKTGSGLKSKEN